MTWSRIACLLLSIPSLALAQPAMPHFTDPWPDPDAVTGLNSQSLSFPSSSPFNPHRILARTAPPATIQAELFEPAGASASHPIPAVILLHGSVGMVHERAHQYGPSLAAMGVAVLVIDTFGSRREMGTGSAIRLINITESMQMADAYAGLRALAARPEIDAHRVALIGFSYGGMSTVFAMNKRLANALAPPGLRFAGHVAYYAPCIARFDDPTTTGAPLLMLYGAKDELIRPDRCAEIAGDLRRGGSQVSVIAYPDAVHEWDGPLARRLIGRDLTRAGFA